MLSIVGVLSCAHGAWIASSRTMGENLARAVGDGAYSNVHTPVDKAGFIACLGEAKYLIIHTHGSPDALYDQRATGDIKKIISLRGIEEMQDIPTVQLIFMTACATAGGDPDKNVASALSKRIAKNGMVFANIYNVWGSDYDFGEKEGKPGWVAYRNGVRVLSPEELPASMTAADAFKIYAHK